MSLGTEPQQQVTLFGKNLTVRNLGVEDNGMSKGVSIDLNGINGDDLLWAMRKQGLVIDEPSEKNGTLTVFERFDKEVNLSLPLQAKSVNEVGDVVEALKKVGTEFNSAEELAQAKQAEEEAEKTRLAKFRFRRPTSVDLNTFAAKIVDVFVDNKILNEEQARLAKADIKTLVTGALALMQREEQQRHQRQ